MLKNWIKDLQNLVTETSDDVNIDVARKNYQKHQEDIRRVQEDYIKKVCREIKIKSREGRKFVDTLAIYDKDFMTPKFLTEMKEYFEQRGFDIKEVKTYWDSTYLKIRWDEEISNGKDI